MEYMPKRDVRLDRALRSFRSLIEQRTYESVDIIP
jgi:hypothetical protein